MIQTTYSNLVNNLIGNLTAGEFYQITDRDNVTLLALNANTLSPKGTAIFLNPDYQKNGTYVSLGSQLGIWNTNFSTVSINDVVIWSGKHYKSLTGFMGLEPDTDAINWEELPKDVDNGYIPEVVNVKYDVLEDEYYEVEDTRGNKLSVSKFTISELGFNPIFKFQFGSDLCGENIITNSMIDNLNSVGFVGRNTLNCQSALICTINSGTIAMNVLENEGTINALGNKGLIILNRVLNTATISANYNTTTGFIGHNFVTNADGLLDVEDNSGNIDGHYIYQGKINAKNNNGSLRGFIMYHGAIANVSNNTGEMGAIIFTIGATLNAERNSGVIKWSQLSNTTYLNANDNKGIISRIIQNGNFTLDATRNTGEEVLFLRADLDKDFTLPSGDVNYKYHNPKSI